MKGWNRMEWMPRTGRSLVCLGIVSLLSLQLGGLSVFAQQAAQANAPHPEPALALQATREPALMEDNHVASANTTNKVLKGSLTKIHVTRGRSQIIKFAQPIMRVSIAEPSMAEIVPLAPDQIMVNGKVRGVTSLIVWDEDGQEGIFDLHIENDTSALLEAIEAVAPNENIRVRVTDDAVILSGQVSNTILLDEIRKTAAGFGFKEEDGNFINLTEAPVPQVHLEVKIAEVNRSVGRELRLGVASNNLESGNKMLGAFSRFDALDIGDNAPPITIGRLHPLVSPAVGGVTGALAHVAGGKEFALRMDALQTNGHINILAEPTLVATHGRVANFLAGGEFPYIKGTDQSGSPLIEFREYGVKLEFTPWIAVRSNRIELKVAPEVSSIDSSNCQPGPGGALVCGILKRSTSTTVELQDGETLMVSGILSREEQNAFQKVPFVGDIPILGAFFKNSDMSKADKELVVIVTPHIVKPNDYGKILGSPR